MSKVQLQYDLDTPLDELLLKRIAAAHGIYGLTLIQVNPAGDSLTVTYDASRLTANEVEAALRRQGIAGNMRAWAMA